MAYRYEKALMFQILVSLHKPTLSLFLLMLASVELDSCNWLGAPNHLSPEYTDWEIVQVVSDATIVASILYYSKLQV